MLAESQVKVSVNRTFSFHSILSFQPLASLCCVNDRAVLNCTRFVILAFIDATRVLSTLDSLRKVEIP